MRVVRLYYAFQLFFGLLLWLPVFYEFQKRIGLSDAQIFGIQSIYYVAFCLLEIPTGMIADRIGYLRCLRAGAAVLVAANLLPVLASGSGAYATFLAHFLLIALSRSLISGASSAYLYEAMRAEGRAAEYKQVEGNARAYGLVAKVVCWAGVGALMEWHLTLPYWLTAAGSAAAVAFAYRLPRLPGQGGVSRAPAALGEVLAGVLGDLRAVVGMLRASRFLVTVMLQGIAIFVLARIVQVNLFQPVLGAKGISVGSYGVVMSAMSLFEAVGSARPAWIRRWFSDYAAVYALTFAMAASMALMSVSGAPGAVAWLCVFSFATGLSFPVQRQLINDAIPDSRYRATLLSAESILDRAVCAWVALVLGEYLGAGRLDELLVRAAGATFAGMALLALAARQVGELRVGSRAE